MIEVKAVFLAMAMVGLAFVLLGAFYVFLYRDCPAAKARITPVFVAAGALAFGLAILYGITLLLEGWL